MSDQPIGVFDSGVGGLSILRELRRELPQETFLYFADQAHVPHGSRSLEEIRQFSIGIAEFLLAKKVKMIVVACNTDSAAALQDLRRKFPEVPFIGMEPAVKPAAEATKNGVIGVIATHATLHSELLSALVAKYAQDVKVLSQPVPGLVERVEAGEIRGNELEAYLAESLAPLLDAGIDELVLGCTHYPFAKDAIQSVVGPNVKIVDPSHAVARQARRILADQNIFTNRKTGQVRFYTSGDPESFSKTIKILLHETAQPQKTRWEGDAILE